jgi:hypothetical protein
MLILDLCCNIIFIADISLEMIVTNQFKRGNLFVCFPKQ